MANIFSKIMMPKVDSNRFDLSHDVKLSFSMGQLIPTCAMDCIPGDKVTISVENMLRFAPLISPVMHKVNVTTHYFFVPTRLLWPEWEQWITGESDAEAPYVRIGGSTGLNIGVGSIGDYIGLPTGPLSQEVRVSPFQIAAYLKIYDEYYRDQNLQTPEFPDPLTAGENATFGDDWFDSQPLHRAWMHDYFTSALPFAQKGDAVQIPLTAEQTIPVQQHDLDIPTTVLNIGTGDPANFGTLEHQAGPVPMAGSVHVDNGTTQEPVILFNSGLAVDVQAEATDINTLRRAFRLQEWLEKNARGGTRYIENILAHFGVKSSDARLQRPHYIGGAKQNMVISEVLATAQSSPDNVAVGTMAGHGISVGGGNRFTYRAEEHGFIIGLINVQPVTAYQEGLHRSFSRFSRLDYAWPTFANIGEQEILQKEVRADVDTGGGLTPDSVFGYIPRYSEYKFMNSRVAGEMRTSLAFWHLGRIFTNNPVLNSEFIRCNPSTRIFAVTESDEDHIYAHIFNNISAVRKLPRYGVPTI